MLIFSVQLMGGRCLISEHFCLIKWSSFFSVSFECLIVLVLFCSGLLSYSFLGFIDEPLYGHIICCFKALDSYSFNGKPTILSSK